MRTIIESPLFSRLWPDYWTEDERGDFCAHLAAHQAEGDLIRGTGGCCKIRWGMRGSGKRGGVRVIYTRHLKVGVVVLLVIYSKSARSSMSALVLREIAKEMGHAP
jgi:hypothetical protein